MKTENGKQIFEQLILGGYILEQPSDSMVQFKYRDRNKTQGDLTFEKYFVTIETYDEQ